MRSKPVALLLADLGIAKTHSLPHTSNDNPCLHRKRCERDGKWADLGRDLLLEPQDGIQRKQPLP